MGSSFSVITTPDICFVNKAIYNFSIKTSKKFSIDIYNKKSMFSTIQENEKLISEFETKRFYCFKCNFYFLRKIP